MNISLELYKTFYYVAKNKNISRAANELMISQPAISKSIRTLEEQLEIKLFIRKRDGVVLTDEGKLLYDKIKNAVEIINSAEEDMNSITNLESGTINIGTSKTIINEFLLKYISDFHTKYPKIKIKIHTDRTNKLLDKMKNGIVDIIFTNLPYPLTNEFKSENILKIHNGLYANNNFKNLKDRLVPLEELKEYPFVMLPVGSSSRIFLDDLFNKNNILIRPSMEIASYTLSSSFIKIGLGIGMLTEEFIQDEIKNEELFEIKTELKIPDRYIGVIYLNNKLLSKCATKFIEIVKEKK